MAKNQRRKSVYNIIMENHKDHGGTLDDQACMELCDCEPAYFYEILAELQDDDPIQEFYEEACRAAGIDPENPIFTGEPTKRGISMNKPAEQMTEQEAKEYCEAIAEKDHWESEYIQMEIAEGKTYRQIAFQYQTT